MQYRRLRQHRNSDEELMGRYWREILPLGFFINQGAADTGTYTHTPTSDTLLYFFSTFLITLCIFELTDAIRNYKISRKLFGKIGSKPIKNCVFEDQWFQVCLQTPHDRSYLVTVCCVYTIRGCMLECSQNPTS